MKNPLNIYCSWISLLLTATAAMSIVACGGANAGSGSKVEPAPQPVAVATATDPRAVPFAPGSGILTVLSVEHQVELSSERDGTVLSVTQDEGSVVKAGQTLGTLDDRSLQMELVKARDDLRVTQNNVKYKEAELKAKSAAHQRQQQLRALGLSSMADLEVAEFQAKGAEYDLHGWEALIEANQAEIQRIEIQIEQTRLHAPFSGVVVRRYIREGQTVSKGDKCFRISQLFPLLVQFQVSETSMPRPSRGVEVALNLVGDSSRKLSARVIKVSPTVDPASDSYNVTAQLTGRESSDLRPGMAVQVFWPATTPANPR